MNEGMGIIERIMEWIVKNRIFVRERKSNAERALGMLLYHAGLSYNKAAIFVNASYEAVRKWYRKGRKLFEQTLMAKKRKKIAIDEKEIRINGMKIFIWAAVDLEDEKVIAVYVSYGRSYFEAMAFLKRVKKACIGKMPRVFIDGGKWYPWALQRMGFNKYTVIKFGPRSAIERFFGNVEWRIRKFWNAFHGKYSVESMQNWIEAFAGFRNFYKNLEVLS